MSTASESYPEAISLGPLKWVREDRLASTWVMTKSEFRAWLRNLHVPTIEHKQGIRYVCWQSFLIATWSISRLGEPDFVLPGSPGANKGVKGLRKGTRNKVDVRRYKREFRRLIAEMIYTRRLNGLFRNEEEIKAVARRAVAKIIASGMKMQGINQMNRFGNEAVRQLRDDPNDDLLAKMLEEVQHEPE